MDRGDNVPDSLTNELVADRIGQSDCVSGFLLDGFPRTTAQVDALNGMLSQQGTALDAVVELVADVEIVVERLKKRAIEQGRTDDDESVVRHRLEVYREQTAPLIDLYGQTGLLVSVDGIGTIDEVTGRIMDELGGRGISA